jgi:LacI family transcriptional regulator
MKDVAALAGVSLKTVSRVINEEKSVNPEMVERVRAAVLELRYQPNFGASALRRSDGRSSQIAVLLQDLSNPFSAVIYRAIEEVAMARGVTVLGASFEEDSSRERDVVATMVRHRVDGFILAPAGQDHAYLVEEQDAGVPVVFVDRTPRGLHADCVRSDSRKGASVAVEHLASFGHRRIAYLGDLSTIPTAQDRLAGYADALTALNIPMDTSLVRKDLRTVEAAERVAAELLSLDYPPTAFFAGQNLLTIGAVRALRAAGLQHKVALVGFDDFMLADMLDPGVTVVSQHVTEIGTQAAHILFRRIDGDHSIDEVLEIPTTLIARGSGEIVAH